MWGTNVYSYPYQPLLWKRFIDDIFIIWTQGNDTLCSFIIHLIEVHPIIKLTHEMAYNEIPFLDLLIYIKGNTLQSRLYTKSTDDHMYLNYHSDHQHSLKKNLFYILSS